MRHRVHLDLVLLAVGQLVQDVLRPYNVCDLGPRPEKLKIKNT
jgi:hypothetical protein